MLSLIRALTPKFFISWYHFGLAFLGAALYGFPSRKLIVIGVTGTNGKSTTVDMLSRIFKEAGFKTASFSSIRFQIKDKEWKNTLKMTMPGRFLIQKLLRQAVNEQCTHAVLEVTSEGILQHRHRFINFHTAVFTNLSPEHIERHGSFEKYREAKGMLFVSTKHAHIINIDDINAPYFLQFPAEKKFFFAMNGVPKEGVTTGINLVSLESGVSFIVDNVTIVLQLLAEFNAYNALAAITVAKSQGIPLAVSKQALEAIKEVPGRMEQIVKSPCKVIVDYAFTPAALEKVYTTLKSLLPPDNSLICVLGAAGGGRDAWKRPVLGKIAKKYCDSIIITNEDPYEEDPIKIMDEVMAQAGQRAKKIEDRREAIRQALLLAKKGDTVVITGKGSEDSIALAGGKKIPWDDREVVREEFQKLTKMGKCAT